MEKQSKLPNKLIIFELANNHMGDVNHAVKIIRTYGKIKKKFKNFSFGFKLQFRDLKTFIHPNMINKMDVHYIKRFKDTELKKNQFKKIINEIKKNNFLAICTPFDEKSVDLLDSLGVEIIKIASCSFTDWPLLEKVVGKKKPIIASTAGATEQQIDKVVTFFKNRNKDFALMHCVAEYPTPNNKLNLNRLKFLKEKYKDIKIGYSTHENPDETNNISMAISMGATIFEKHIGLKTEKYSLNKYSANTAQTEKWLQNAKRAYEICGESKNFFKKNKKEIEGLLLLKRGVYAKSNISKGTRITSKNSFLAFPPKKNQILADNFSKYSQFIAKKNILKKQAIEKSNTKIINNRKDILKIIEQTNKKLKKCNHTFSGNIEYEISHHYGLEKFRKYGLVLLNILNGKYCKKILVIFPGQTHPEQYHLKKTETFHVLDGDVKLKLNKKKHNIKKGDIITINPKTKHEFSSKNGAVIEEISSTHYKSDSFYTDKKIKNNLNRKTKINYYWI
tara:strand:+ start:962 stop:2476 length:1515 start_codon:yes stop_codon:yes gene_type:complete